MNPEANTTEDHTTQHSPQEGFLYMKRITLTLVNMLAATALLAGLQVATQAQGTVRPNAALADGLISGPGTNLAIRSFMTSYNGKFYGNVYMLGKYNGQRIRVQNATV